jgi:hypothetical protein
VRHAGFERSNYGAIERGESTSASTRSSRWPPAWT